ncbi:MAG TPA: CrcB family protein [Acidimicrobiales bacterium]|nr:CrcB family protein [Acidimicrobiales bacterium]
MTRAVLVAVAGALGALARYGIGTAVGVRSFPWATLVINMAGSFALGFVLGGPGAARWSSHATTAVAVGFLGAFTTFSTFAFEGTALVRDERVGAAALYVGLSVVLGLLAAAAGFVTGRSTT